MKKNAAITLFIASLFIFSGCPHTVAPLQEEVGKGVALWAKMVDAVDPDLNETSAESAFIDVATDKSLNVLAVGKINDGKYKFSDSVEVEGIYSDGAPVIAKYSANGNVRWARTLVNSGIGSSIRSSFLAVSVDNSRNAYAAGSFMKLGLHVDAIFDTNVSLRSICTKRNPMLVKYSPDGAALWARGLAIESQPDSCENSEFLSVASDSAGNVYAVGYIGKSTADYDFGNGVTVKAIENKYNTPFLVKYNSRGVALWAHAMTADQVSRSSAVEFDAKYLSVATDQAGNVFVSGSIQGAKGWRFDGRTTTSITGVNPDTQSPVLVAYDSGGAPLWMKTITTLVNAYYSGRFESVSTDASGNVYVGGLLNTVNNTIPSNYSFGNNVFISQERKVKGFLVKYNNAGSAAWVVTTSEEISADQERLVKVVADSFGNVYGSAPAQTGKNSMLLKVDSESGVELWSRLVVRENESSAAANMYGLAVDVTGKIFSVGYSAMQGGIISFGDGVYVNNENLHSALLIKYE